MTRDFVSFFRDRDLDPGHTYAWTAVEPDGPRCFRVYARTPLDEPAVVQAQRAARPEASSSDLDRLDRLLSEAGGGIVLSVPADPGDGGSRIRIRVLSGREYQTATRMLLIDPGAGARMIELETGELELPFGGHLVVPVDEGSLELLSGLRGYLRGLPSDMEQHILRVVAEPGLEARVRRLESRHVQPAADSLLGGRSWWVTVTLLLVLNVVLTVVVLSRSAGPRAAAPAVATDASLPSSEAVAKEDPAVMPPRVAPSRPEGPAPAPEASAEDPSAGSEPRAGGHRRVRDEPVEGHEP